MQNIFSDSQTDIQADSQPKHQIETIICKYNMSHIRCNFNLIREMEYVIRVISLSKFDNAVNGISNINSKTLHKISWTRISSKIVTIIKISQDTDLYVAKYANRQVKLFEKNRSCIIASSELLNTYFNIPLYNIQDFHLFPDRHKLCPNFIHSISKTKSGAIFIGYYNEYCISISQSEIFIENKDLKIKITQTGGIYRIGIANDSLIDFKLDVDELEIFYDLCSNVFRLYATKNETKLEFNINSLLLFVGSPSYSSIDKIFGSIIHDIDHHKFGAVYFIKFNYEIYEKNR